MDQSLGLFGFMNGRLCKWCEVNHSEIFDVLEESSKPSKDGNALGRQVSANGWLLDGMVEADLECTLYKGLH